MLLCCGVFAIDSSVATVPPHLSTTLNPNASVVNATSKCRIVATDATLRQQVDDILARKAKLIEYNFSVKNYTVNPLASGNTWMYKSHMWSRVGTSHGQTILNLAFNYDVLSLMTLSFGVEQLDVQLQVTLGPRDAVLAWRPSSFVYHRLILLTLCVGAMLWSMEI